jgi:hypothetical protein
MASFYNSEIKIILDDIKDYKKINKIRPTNKIDVILRIRDILVKHNYPNQLIYSKILDLLKDYDIRPQNIIYILDLYAGDPSKTEKFYEFINSESY